MAKHINTSGGMLILPDGTEVPNGEAVEISAKTAENAGVAGWIKDGALSREADEGEGEGDGGDSARTDAIRAAIGALDPATDFTKGGKPEVDAISALVEGEPVTATERDAVWADMQKDA